MSSVEPKRLILSQPIAIPTDIACEAERAVIAELKPGTVMM